MEKQRDVYRQLILKLLKANFDSALFQEKRDDLCQESDFETIRNEIEEEYFIKNRGITPYIKAIKYLRAKIEASTAAKSLFATLEDYISAKENIVITKIPNVPVIDLPGKVKKSKRTKAQLKEATDTVQTHADCVSPHPCKKCRIMRRSDVVPKKQKRKPRARAVKKSDIKIEPSEPSEPSEPQYSDISDSETTTAESSFNSTESTMPTVAEVKKEEKPLGLPYDDHQYSRISFYGSGITEGEQKTVENSTEVDETKPEKGEDTVSTNTQTASKANNHTINSLLDLTPTPAARTTVPMPMPTVIPMQVSSVKPVPNLLPSIPERFKRNKGIRQPSPVHFMQHTMPNTSTVTTVQAPTTVIRPIARPVPQPNPSIFVAAPLPFNAPVTMLQHQGSVNRHPVYYIRFCQPPSHQFYPNNLL